MEINLLEIFKRANAEKASDIFIVVGLPLSIKVKGEMIYLTPEGEKIAAEYEADGRPIMKYKLTMDDTVRAIKEIFEIAKNPNWEKFLETGDADFSMPVQGVGRFRVNTYRQRGSLAAVMRLVAFGLPDPATIGIPPAVIELYKNTKGLILVTGPTGSGKSTTLACIVDAINKNRKGHIMTLEDPIEFMHSHKKSIVSQREVPADTLTYMQALKAVLRQSPDVIQIGEMRDIDTISIALTAAETGHLVLSTLHTSGAAATIDRIVDIFPPQAQHQVRLQLSMTLRAVVSQILVPTIDKGLAAAFEVMINTNAVSNMIRENKLNQINSTIHTSGDVGMQTMDASLVALVKKGAITKDNAMLYSQNPDIIVRMI